MATEEELREARRRHAADLRKSGRGAFPNDFRTDEDTERLRRELAELANDEARAADLPSEEEAELGTSYPLYGRVVAKRGPFLVIRTPHGDVQALVRPENLPDEEALQLKLVDLADHVFVEGPAMSTRTGAAAVKAKRYRHLGKALLPPPAKWHGLKDVEKRYRERYVDLFANPAVAEVFRARTRIVQELRRFLDGLGFLEVETPLLHQVRGGATARPFVTHHNALDLDLFLRIAPELYLKRLLVGGFDRVYEIGRCFRNEGISTRHNPEFTILEFYVAYANYRDLIELTQQMLRHVDSAVCEHHPELTENRSFDLGEFREITMRNAIAERVAEAGRNNVDPTPWAEVLDRHTVYEPDALVAAYGKIRDRLDEDDRKLLDKCETHGERIFALFETLVEGQLTRMFRTEDGTRSLPVFVTEFPVEVSPLSRPSDHDSAWVDRFELFIEGREVVNAFSELNDPDLQAERFRGQLDARDRGDEEAMDYDADYVRALEHGMPPAAGFGLGIDRLCMTLCKQPSIRDVLLFPLLRPGAG